MEVIITTRCSLQGCRRLDSTQETGLKRANFRPKYLGIRQGGLEVLANSAHAPGPKLKIIVRPKDSEIGTDHRHTLRQTIQYIFGSNSCHTQFCHPNLQPKKSNGYAISPMLCSFAATLKYKRVLSKSNRDVGFLSILRENHRIFLRNVRRTHFQLRPSFSYPFVADD